MTSERDICIDDIIEQYLTENALFYYRKQG